MVAHQRLGDRGRSHLDGAERTTCGVQPHSAVEPAAADARPGGGPFHLIHRGEVRAIGCGHAGRVHERELAGRPQRLQRGERRVHAKQRREGERRRRGHRDRRAQCGVVGVTDGGDRGEAVEATTQRENDDDVTSPAWVRGERGTHADQGSGCDGHAAKTDPLEQRAARERTGARALGAAGAFGNGRDLSHRSLTAGSGRASPRGPPRRSSGSKTQRQSSTTGPCRPRPRGMRARRPCARR